MGVVPLLYCSVMCIALLLSLFTIYVLLIHSIWIQGFRSIPLLVYYCTIVVFKTFINVSNILAPMEYSRYTLVDIKAWSWFTSACLRMITLYSYYVLWYFSSVWSTRSYLVVPSLVTRDSWLVPSLWPSVPLAMLYLILRARTLAELCEGTETLIHQLKVTLINVQS